MRPLAPTRSAAVVLAAAGIAAALAGSCRTLDSGLDIQVPQQALDSHVASAVKAPVVRVGILTEAARASIGADAGVVVRGVTPPGVEKEVRVMRATFFPVASEGDATRLVETGDLFRRAIVFPDGSGGLSVEASAYRGLLEVRGNGSGGLTVINIVNLEDYVKGVVPNELSPQAYPELEALKAQAVAARTYALRNTGQYKAKGYDICATAACQVYRGRASESALSDRAVDETQGIAATYAGRLINALYTSTCGGHTEDASNVFEGDDAPYLRGVACAPERTAWATVKTLASPLTFPESGSLGRDVALLAAWGVIDGKPPTAQALRAAATDGEVRSWTARLLAALHRKGCESEVDPPLSRRGSLFAHVVGSLCWEERARRLLAPEDPGHLLRIEDVGALRDSERQAAALLVQEGSLTPFADNTLRPNLVATKAQVLSLLAESAIRAGGPGLESADFLQVATDGIVLEVEGSSRTFSLEPDARLFRSLDGLPLASSELTLVAGQKVRFVSREGRIVFLEAQESRLGAAADHTSRYYRWEVRLTPEEVAKAVTRYGVVGHVRDVVPKRLGVSGRVVELAVRGTGGDVLLQGLRVRWGLGLRENLFVVDREIDSSGAIERFVFTGKGWGHGVGLCQVGAYGMARSGSTHEAILKHYYTGIGLTRPAL